MELDLVDHRHAFQVHRRRPHVPSNEHKVAGAADDRVVRRLDVVGAAHDRDGALQASDPESDLCERHASQAVEAGGYGSPLGDACDSRRRVRRDRHAVVEDEDGAEGGGGLADAGAGHAVDDDVAGLVYGLLLEKGEVE